MNRALIHLNHRRNRITDILYRKIQMPPSATGKAAKTSKVFSGLCQRILASLDIARIKTLHPIIASLTGDKNLNNLWDFISDLQEIL
jgi:hypothetical protein